MIVLRARPVELAEPASAGTIVALSEEGPVVACGEGGLVLEELDAGSAELVVGARLG